MQYSIYEKDVNTSNLYHVSTHSTTRKAQAAMRKRYNKNNKNIVPTHLDCPGKVRGHAYIFEHDTVKPSKDRLVRSYFVFTYS